ncbi:MAG: hypothetical protein Q8906_05065 [Bacillota bacterium]|nr:hypothetical protein [Bacillota bacterium]MDP4169960.1 hypothetical protein [Bacillota bacterium]
MEDISIISITFTVLLALGCLYLILTPLFKWEAYWQLGDNESDSSVTKESLLTTLNEIEFEYKMDKISEKDYKVLKRQYESYIAGIMKDEEQVEDKEVDKDLMAEVEKEIEATMLSYKKKKGEEK